MDGVSAVITKSQLAEVLQYYRLCVDDTDTHIQGQQNNASQGWEMLVNTKYLPFPV